MWGLDIFQCDPSGYGSGRRRLVVSVSKRDVRSYMCPQRFWGICNEVFRGSRNVPMIVQRYNRFAMLNR